MRISTKARLAVLAMAAGAIVTASPALASGGSTAVIKTGQCSATSTWKLKAKPDNGQLEVEFEVDSNVVGQTWNVRLLDNGTSFFSGARTTQAPSGSFTVRRLTANRAGTDSIVGRASNPKTGETCQGRVAI
ncbi:MAG: hypothetical protein QOG64_3131 [Acidimicrobiaceae bacterium]|nr:hypothetical protein [Acidimicrobiaceae bacterium]